MHTINYTITYILYIINTIVLIAYYILLVVIVNLLLYLIMHQTLPIHTKHSTYRVWYYSWVQASAGSLGIYHLWVWRTTVALMTKNKSTGAFSWKGPFR